MKTPEEAYEIGEKYLEDRKRRYVSLSSLERVFFPKDTEILYRGRKGENVETFTV